MPLPHVPAAEKRKGIPMSKATKKKLSESIKSSEKRKKTMASKEYREKMSRSIKNSDELTNTRGLYLILTINI